MHDKIYTLDYIRFMAPRRIELRTPPRQGGSLPLAYEAKYAKYQNTKSLKTLSVRNK